MKRVLIFICFLTLLSCGDESLDIRLKETNLTLEGKELTLFELADELKAITASGDTPMVKLVISENASMGDVNMVRLALKEASLVNIRQYMK